MGYSQKNEDEIIECIFSKLNITIGTAVECGASDGITLSNTRKLLEKGWGITYIEGNKDLFNSLVENTKNFNNVDCLNYYISNEPNYKLDHLLYLYTKTPSFFDFFSLDIDGLDYWVWKDLNYYFPKVVCIEYNPNFEPTESRVIEYDPKFRHDNTNYYGASALALYNLGIEKGYTLINHTEDLNLFFVQNCFSHLFEKYDITNVKKNRHHTPSKRIMIEI
jgi:hypothetical protein